MKRADLQKEDPRVLKLFIELILAIFVIESLVMALLHIFIEPLHLSALAEGFLDSFALVIFILPTLYLLFYRPLSLEIARYKQALERAHGLDSSYNVIIQEAIDGFWMINTQGRILDVNDAYCRLTGYSREELLRMSIPDLEAMETSEETALRIRKIKEAGADRFETRHRAKDGRIMDIEVSVNYLTVDGGRLFAFLRDITERKKAEMSLEKLAAAVSQTADLVVITDRNGNIEYVNPAFEIKTGYKSEEVIGKTPRIIKSGIQNQSFYEGLWKTILSGEVFRGVLVNRRKDGQLYYSDKTITPIKDTQGNIANFVSTDKDISERKKAEEGLLRLNKELLELDRMKSEFINMASHELRTPIAITREGISQVAEGLHGELAAEQKHFVSISLNNINRLIDIVGSIFDISELEFGKPELRLELADIVELVRKVIADFSQKAKDKGLEIRQSFPEKKIEFSLDKERIRQVFSELIKNAINFSDSGSVEIKMQERDNRVECSISDTGRGIHEEVLPYIFDKFRQSGRKYGPGPKGVGLGLAIAKAIVERHKGKIWVESKPGQGATFTFSLPKENDRNPKP